MTLATNRLGRIGEQMAVRHLLALGYEIIERNWRAAAGELRGEVDIVARDGTELVFCEVKTRRRSVDGDDALLAVSFVKQRQLRRLAIAFLATRPTRDVRFDVVAVTWPPTGGAPVVTHVKAAF
jgi:putative endonuclease